MWNSGSPLSLEQNSDTWSYLHRLGESRLIQSGLLIINLEGTLTNNDIYSSAQGSHTPLWLRGTRAGQAGLAHLQYPVKLHGAPPRPTQAGDTGAKVCSITPSAGAWARLETKSGGLYSTIYQSNTHDLPRQQPARCPYSGEMSWRSASLAFSGRLGRKTAIEADRPTPVVIGYRFKYGHHSLVVPVLETDFTVVPRWTALQRRILTL